MKKSASKFMFLGRYEISPAEIESLGRDIERLGTEGTLQLTSITVQFGSQEVKYDSPEELRVDMPWKKRIEKFTLSFHEVRSDGHFGPRSISIGGGTWLDNHVLIRGEEEGWVVGTGKVVKEMMQRYEVWYKYLLIDPVVKVVYPIILTMLATYLVATGWIRLTPDVSQHVRLSEDAIGIISLSAVFITCNCSPDLGSRMTNS